MKLMKPTVSRFLSVSLAIILQIGFIVLVSNAFEEAEPVINNVVRFLSFVVIGFVINEKSNPSIKMAWLFFILITPVFGSILYILTGGKAPRKWLRDALSGGEEKNRKYPSGQSSAEKLKESDAGLYSQSRYLENLGFPVLRNGGGEYFSLGDDMFPVMLSELEKAEKFIFMEYFIIDDGEMLSKLLEILERKAKAGVEVRIIYDDMGSLFTLPKGYEKTLERKGIKTIAFNPFVPLISAAMNNRDHRKILVIDSLVAFTGGINLADEYINKVEKYGHWKDNAVMIKGEGVLQFTKMFLEMWNSFRDKKEDNSKFFNVPCSAGNECGFIQPFGDTPLDDELVGENVYMNAINNAREYVYIYTPYLIPDHEMSSALRLAAKRGVDVRLIVPGIPDKKMVYSMTKSYYGSLIEAGVRICKYTKGFVHAKGFVCDDIIACAGTINLDFRSLYHHFECGCVFYKTDVVRMMKEDMLKTLEECETVTEYMRFKGVVGRTYHAIVRLLAPLA